MSGNFVFKELKVEKKLREYTEVFKSGENFFRLYKAERRLYILHIITYMYMFSIL